MLDWKEYSRKWYILRTQVSAEGNEINWTKVMQVKICKAERNVILYKISHLEKSFKTLWLPESRRSSAGRPASRELPNSAYSNKPKTSKGKFKDLVSQEGRYPVIQNLGRAAFYKNLPDWNSVDFSLWKPIHDLFNLLMYIDRKAIGL